MVGFLSFLLKKSRYYVRYITYVWHNLADITMLNIIITAGVVLYRLLKLLIKKFA